MDTKNRENIDIESKHKKSSVNGFFEKHVVNIRKKMNFPRNDGKFIDEDKSIDTDSQFLDQSSDCYEANSKSFSKKRIILLVATSFFILISALALLVLNEMYSFFKYEGRDRVVDIPYGSSISKIAYILNENDIIDYPWVFSTYASFKKQNNLKHGAFNLNTSMSYDEIINILSSDHNNINQVKFVIFDGLDMFDMCEANAHQSLIDPKKVMEELNNRENYSKYNFTKNISQSELSGAYYPMEGFCALCTFYLDSGSNPKSIANKILEQTDNILSDLQEDIQNSGMSLWEIMTTASIIQAETSNVDDMRKISSVIHNRYRNLDQYKRLQCDPTSKYATKIKKDMQKNGDFDENKANRYDTYKCSGLPAGPICNPSVEAIKAAINPEKTDFYFFCANVKMGEVFYAKTLSEHEANLKKLGFERA